MDRYMQIQFNADLKNVVFSRGVVASFFLEEKYCLNTVNEVKTIVSEAVTNSIVHGYNNDSSKEVTLFLSLNNDILEIIVKDDGVGIYDIEKAKEPLFSSKPKEERAGLGFTIMEIFSDSLEITSTINAGTTVKLLKHLNI